MHEESVNGEIHLVSEESSFTIIYHIEILITFHAVSDRIILYNLTEEANTQVGDSIVLK